MIGARENRVRLSPMAILASAALVGACGSGSSATHTAAAPELTQTALTAGKFKVNVVEMYKPFSKSPLPQDLSVGAAEYDGFADSVQALPVAPVDVSERGTVVSGARACAAALRAHPDLSTATSMDYQACFSLQAIVTALPG